jgi:serine/threonine protein kinase
MFDHFRIHVMKDASKAAPHMRIVQTTVGEYDHETATFVLATANSKIYVAIKRGIIRSSDVNATDVSTWYQKSGYIAPVRVYLTKMYTEALASYHPFRWRKGEPSEAIFKKKQNPLVVAAGQKNLYVVGKDSFSAELTAREIATCEFFRDHPHPNIAKYRGVIAKDSLEFGKGRSAVTIELDTKRVYALVFKRYDCDLWTLVEKRKRFDVRYCLQSIEAGIVYMHSLGLSHTDIKPDNIFVEKTHSSLRPYEFVLGDFDSTARIGSRIVIKGGDWAWSPHKAEGKPIHETDDWYAFQNLKIWAVREMGGRIEHYDGIGKWIEAAQGPRFNR